VLLQPGSVAVIGAEPAGPARSATASSPTCSPAATAAGPRRAPEADAVLGVPPCRRSGTSRAAPTSPSSPCPPRAC
jgi:hypothetical protein